MSILWQSLNQIYLSFNLCSKSSSQNNFIDIHTCIIITQDYHLPSLEGADLENWFPEAFDQAPHGELTLEIVRIKRISMLTKDEDNVIHTNRLTQWYSCLSFWFQQLSFIPLNHTLQDNPVFSNCYCFIQSAHSRSVRSTWSTVWPINWQSWPAWFVHSNSSKICRGNLINVALTHVLFGDIPSKRHCGWFGMRFKTISRYLAVLAE